MHTAVNQSADHDPSTSSRATAKANNAAQVVKSALSSATDAIAKTADTARRRTQHVMSTTDDFVRLNPWQAVGLAALAGVAIGFLARRRS